MDKFLVAFLPDFKPVPSHLSVVLPRIEIRYDRKIPVDKPKPDVVHSF